MSEDIQAESAAERPNTDAVAFRVATEGDRGFITEMFRETDTWGDPGKDLSEHFQDDLVRYVDMWTAEQGGIIAEYEGAPAGAAWLRNFTESEPGAGYISDDIPELAIALRPTMTGLGLGRKLLGTTLDHARAKGYHSVSLAVDFGNDRARRMYSKFGFIDHGVAPHEECYVMVYCF